MGCLEFYVYEGEREKGSDDSNEVPGPSPLFLRLVIASAFLNPIFYMRKKKRVPITSGFLGVSSIQVVLWRTLDLGESPEVRSFISH